ncbi:PAS domain-containing protein [candidate division WOR-3 bacterium]|nr:PAS domain-containing protein [candidate division WOR-3 bacterium]
MTNKRSKKENKDAFLKDYNIYSEIIEEINAPLCFLDPNGEFLLSNPSCDDLLGISKGNLRGRNLKEFISPKMFKKVKEWIKNGDDLPELEISKKEGKNNALHVISSPKYNKKSKYIGSLVFFEDISVRKKFECKLQEQIEELQKELVFKNNLLSSLLYKTPDHVYFKDRESRFVRVSRAFVEDLGIENFNDVIGKTDFDFFTKSHAEQAYREEQEMIKTKKPVIGKIIEESYLNGKRAWVSTTKVPWYNEKGNVIGILGVSRNITETKELEKKLKKRLAELGEEVILKSNLLSALLDNTPDHVYFKDKKSRFIQASKSVVEKLRLKSVDELIGKTDFDYFTDEHAEEAFRDEQKIMETGKPIEGKIERETYSDGRIAWVSTTKIPRYDEKGNIIGTLGISRDITQQKEKEIKEKLKDSAGKKKPEDKG